MGGPKRHIQPERYAQFELRFYELFENGIDRNWYVDIK
jgi:hypothetical protein